MFRISTRVPGLLAAAAACGALAVAAPASALTLLSASMDTSNTAYITGPGYSVDAYIGPVTFHATNGGPAFDFTAYCVDIFHDMFLGPLNGGAGYGYHAEALTTDSKTSTGAGQAGDALSVVQLQDISGLLNYSDTLTDAGAADLSRRLAGIQGAIWEIENPGYSVNGSAQVNAYIAEDVAKAGHLPVGTMHSVFADDWSHQAFASGGVPEPATWTMLIMGFGGVGALLRRRRVGAAFA